MPCQNCGKYTGPFLFCGKVCHDAFNASNNIPPGMPAHPPQQQRQPQQQRSLCAKPGCDRPVFRKFPHCGKFCYNNHQWQQQQQAIPQLPALAPIQCNNVGCSNPPHQGHHFCGKGCAPDGHRHKGIRCKNIRCSKPKHQQFDYCGQGCMPGGHRNQGNK